MVVTRVMQFPCRGTTESTGYTRHMSRGSTAEILFDLLASAPAGQTLSGQALALRCGVSRAAIWKQVATLRALGLPIHGRAGSGYRLGAPIERLDATRIVAAAARPAGAPDVAVRWRCDSTNSELLRGANGGLRSGAACLAEVQDAGRGRRGRDWYLPLGGGVALSVLWRFDEGMSRLGGLSLVAGVALMRALEEFGIDDCGLKWPNDAVSWVANRSAKDLSGRPAKFAGILVELGGDALGPCHAVIGVGINVRLGESAVAPRETASSDHPWTDLARLADDAPPGRNALAGRVLARLVEALTAFAERGFEPFRDAFARYDVLAGRNVRVLTAGATRAALALGVDAHGALRLRDGNGEFVVTSGEVSVRTGDEA